MLMGITITWQIRLHSGCACGIPVLVTWKPHDHLVITVDNSESHDGRAIIHSSEVRCCILPTYLTWRWHSSTIGARMSTGDPCADACVKLFT